MGSICVFFKPNMWLWSFLRHCKKKSYLVRLPFFFHFLLYIFNAASGGNQFYFLVTKATDLVMFLSVFSLMAQLPTILALNHWKQLHGKMARKKSISTYEGTRSWEASLRSLWKPALKFFWINLSSMITFKLTIINSLENYHMLINFLFLPFLTLSPTHQIHYHRKRRKYICVDALNLPSWIFIEKIIVVVH